MRLLTSSDWQTQFSNIRECEHSLEELLDLQFELKPDALILLGDLKNQYNPIDTRVANFWVRSIQRLVKASSVYALLGNHDRISQNRESENWLAILRAAGARTISKPRVVFIGDGTVYFLPFTPDKKLELQWAALLAVKLGHGPRVLCFHTQVLGAWFNNVIRAEDGITPAELFHESYTVCLGGHFHRHQKLEKNIWYIGAPFCHEWGEANQLKGHVLVDITKTK